jgi:hypothetical protein
MREHTVQEFLRAGGRLCHLRDKNGKRVVTVAYYSTKRSIPTIYYGASIFQYDANEPVFNKHVRRANNQQAVDRCCNHPVDIDDIASDLHPFICKHLGIGHIDYLRRLWLREHIQKFGVQDLISDSFDVFQLMVEEKAYAEY